MKHNDIHSVGEGLNYIGTMIKILLISSFFLSSFYNAQAQNSNYVKGKFIPLVATTDNVKEVNVTGELWLIGFEEVAGINFPYSFEWRKDNHLGRLISRGIVKESFDKKNYTDTPIDGSKITNLNPGKYVLIVFDNSNPTKQLIREFLIK